MIEMMAKNKLDLLYFTIERFDGIMFCYDVVKTSRIKTIRDLKRRVQREYAACFANIRYDQWGFLTPDIKSFARLNDSVSIYCWANLNPAWAECWVNNVGLHVCLL